MTKEVFEDRSFTRLKQLEYLIRTQQTILDFAHRSQHLIGGVFFGNFASQLSTTGGGCLLDY